MKDLLIIGNWKLNGNKKTIINSMITLIHKCINISKCHIAIAPPLVYLDIVRYYLQNITRIRLCAQNVDIHLSGSFTGDISADMLKDLNVQYVLIGHSERRTYHKEDNLYIAKKFAILKKTGLIPILCIGENKEEYEANNTQTVCIKQIHSIITYLGVQSLKNSIIAYEPIWAIGQGISPSPERVQMIHKGIRDYIAQFDTYIAKHIPIQYGGSVNTNNIVNLLSQKDIDGVLVGSASLDVHNFFSIIELIETHINKKYEHF